MSGQYDERKPVWLVTVKHRGEKNSFAYAFALTHGLGKEVAWQAALEEAQHLADIDPDLDVDELLDGMKVTEVGKVMFTIMGPLGEEKKRAIRALNQKGYYVYYVKK